MTILIRAMFLILKLVENSTIDNVSENAIGVYQIRPIFVEDVNRILGFESYTHEEARNERLAQQMIFVYLNHYGRMYTDLTGKQPDARVLARIFNGGPKGYLKRATINYGNRAMNIWEDQNEKISKM